MSIAALKGFISALQLDIKRLDQLTVMLEQQYEFMSTRNSQQLEILNHQALELMNTINQSNTEREKFLAGFGLSPDRAGIQQLLTKLPQHVQDATGKLLQELAVKSRLCQAMNEKSGRLLASQRQLVQKLTGTNTSTSYPDMPL